MVELEYNNFDNVEDSLVRTWNRCATAFNIFVDESKARMTEYLSQFSKSDKQEVLEMFDRISDEGYNNVKASISRHAQTLPREEEDDIECSEV